MRDDPECLPSSGTLRSDREPPEEHRSPGPARSLSRLADPRATLSRHPGPSPDPAPHARPGPDHDVRFARHQGGPEASSRAPLGPRPPAPMPLFGGRTRGLIRDQASPDDFCNETRRTGMSPGLCESSRGRGPRPSSDALANEGGEPRSRRRRFRRAHPVPPACAGLPERCASASVPCRAERSSTLTSRSVRACPWTERRTRPRFANRAVPA